MKRYRRPSLVLMSLIGVGALGCGGQEPASPHEGPTRPAATAPAETTRETTTATPSAHETGNSDRTSELAEPVRIRATGTAEPIRAADLSPAMTALITALPVHEGDAVRAGEAIVRLDGRAARANVAQARAAAQAARVQRSQAESDLARLGPFAERGALPENQLVQLRNQREAAQAQAEAAAAAANAAAVVARNAIVRAPFDGVVVSLPKEVGEIATAVPPTIVARVVDLRTLQIRARVHERAFGHVEAGQPVTVRFPSLGHEVVGRVERVGREISDANRTFEVIVQVDNREGELPGGLFAEVELRIDHALAANQASAHAHAERGTP